MATAEAEQTVMLAMGAAIMEEVALVAAAERVGVEAAAVRDLEVGALDSTVVVGEGWGTRRPSKLLPAGAAYALGHCGRL